MLRPTFSALAISDRRSQPGDFREWLAALAAAGVEALQLREKDLDDQELFALARLARTLLPPPTLLLINGRADIALATGADGVHLPAEGLPIAPLRSRFGSSLLLGRSTHNVGEVEAAAREGADYVTFGPVYPTPGKGPACGIGGLAAATGRGVGVFALGGVKIERLSEIAAVGASGVAGIRLFQEPAHLAALVAATRRSFVPAGDGGAPSRNTAHEPPSDRLRGACALAPECLPCRK